MKVEERYRNIPGVKPANRATRAFMEVVSDATLYRHVSGFHHVEEALRLQEQGHPLITVSNHLSLFDPWAFKRTIKKRGYGDLDANTVFFTGRRIEQTQGAKQLITSTPRISVWPHTEEPKTLEEKKEAFEVTKASLAAAKGVLTGDRMNLFIYPEGTRTRTGGMNRPPEAVVGYFTRAEGTVVLPTAVELMDERFPRGSFIPHPGEVILHIGKPIDVSHLRSYNSRQKAEQYAEFEETVMKNGIAVLLPSRYRGVYNG